MRIYYYHDKTSNIKNIKKDDKNMKIPDRDLKQDIIEQLSELPVYYTNRTHSQHMIRCTACGDSHTLSHAHLSIHIDTEDDLPMFYRCFRCNDSGIVNYDKLLEWGIGLDEDSAASLKIYAKKTRKKYKGLFDDRYENYFIPEAQMSIIESMKLEYLNIRLGVNLDLDTARSLKIVTNIEELFRANYIKPEIPPQIRQQIQSNFIGFLSTNNNRIMCRNTKSTLTESDYRWYNVILNSKNMNPYTFYSIPNSIDLYYTHSINVHIAEGIFDILSIYHNLQNCRKENEFYYASCGAAASNIINFLIDRGINTGINLHLYADKDKSDAFHMKYLKKESELYQWCDKIIIHRNQFSGEKDYGVSADHIADSYRTIYHK